MWNCVQWFCEISKWRFMAYKWKLWNMSVMPKHFNTIFMLGFNVRLNTVFKDTLSTVQSWNTPCVHFFLQKKSTKPDVYLYHWKRLKRSYCVRFSKALSCHQVARLGTASSGRKLKFHLTVKIKIEILLKGDCFLFFLILSPKIVLFC